jgi:hypothetical protein
MVPPGEVASPFLSTEPAVFAPCVLASFADGIELLAAPREASFLIAAPPPAVVPPFMESPVVVLLAAGPPACELPPAEPPACASANVCRGRTQRPAQSSCHRHLRKSPLAKNYSSSVVCRPMGLSPAVIVMTLSRLSPPVAPLQSASRAASANETRQLSSTLSTIRRNSGTAGYGRSRNRRRSRSSIRAKWANLISMADIDGRRRRKLSERVFCRKADRQI